MGRIAEKYRYPVTPECDPGAVVQGPDYRFTVLTPSLIRAEYHADGCFEDRATQVVVNRRFPVPAFTVERTGHTLRILTDEVELCYAGGPFTGSSLLLRLRAYRQDWHWGDQTPVLPGTTRTLDEVNGACPLQPSILSAHSVAVLDDSAGTTSTPRRNTRSSWPASAPMASHSRWRSLTWTGTRCTSTGNTAPAGQASAGTRSSSRITVPC